MCLYPKRMINKKYTVTEKNQGNVPKMADERCAYVEIPCGQCIECREQKAREWMVRLGEELQNWEYKYFITLTFAPKELELILKKTGLKECNAAAEYAVRHMLERWRKRYKKSLKHWFITELGHEGTERIHLHGIIFTNEKQEFELINKIGDKEYYKWQWWKYGIMNVGKYCNVRSTNYIVKYMTKIDTDHKGFIGQVLCSPGIGRSFLEKQGIEQYKYKPHESKDYYRLNNGKKIKLPKYYKNHLYNEEERELIWRDFMDKEQTTIAGNTYYDKFTSNNIYGNIIGKAREKNKEFGYGDNSREWRKKEWNITRRMLQQVERKKRMDEMRKALNMPLLGAI